MLEAAVKNIATQTVTDLLGLDDKSTAEFLATSLREMLLRVDSVCAITGLSVPTVYRLMSRGDFPRPIKITGYARAWKLSEIMNWIDGRERDAAPASLNAPSDEA
jgi:prophage regulatory protein